MYVVNAKCLFVMLLEELTIERVLTLRTAKHTEYSVIFPDELGGGSHDKWAPSDDLDILIDDGAPGYPGLMPLNAAG